MVQLSEGRVVSSSGSESILSFKGLWVYSIEGLLECLRSEYSTK